MILCQQRFQGRVIHHRAPAGVDQQAAGLQLVQGSSVKQVITGPGLLPGQFRVQGDHIAGQNFRQGRSVLDSRLIKPGVVDLKTYAHSLQAAGDSLANDPVANDTDGAPGQQTLHVVIDGGNGSQYIFHHRVGIGSRCVAKPNALPGKILTVDMIYTTGCCANKAHSAACQQLFVDSRDRAHQQHIRASQVPRAQLAPGKAPHLTQLTHVMLHSGDVFIGKEFECHSNLSTSGERTSSIELRQAKIQFAG